MIVRNNCSLPEGIYWIELERGITTNEKIAQLREILDDSIYTVALCDSGMMGEGGFISIKKQDKTYDIENRYSYGAKEMYTSAFYDTRPERFFEFYKKEVLHNAPRDTAFGPALAAMERVGKLQCIIDSNIYDKALRGDCYYIIDLHGSIYQNQCPRYKKEHPTGYIADTKRIPVCRGCNVPIRPIISLAGEMVDSQNMTRTTEEIAKANILPLLGTTLASEVFCRYIRYFAGRNMVTVHKQEHYLDKNADLVILDRPMNVLPQLRCGGEKTEE